MIDQSRLGDETYRREIVERLWQEYSHEIRQHCITWLGSGLAEEVTQEVFVAAWQGLVKYRPDNPLRAWLYGIARNKCQQAYRNRARRSTIAQTFLEEIRERSHAENPRSPEESASESGQIEQLHRSMSQLPDEARILLNLRYWRNLPMRDIAEIVGKSVPTIRKRLGQAEQRLKEYMVS